MLDKVKIDVCNANIALAQSGLVILTWGNVSARVPDTGYIVIKPSGVSYDQMTPDQMSVVDLSGQVVDGLQSPSSDTPTHLELYRRYPHIGSIVHTHSKWATIWAQMGKAIPPLGTTHADDFWGEIPCTRPMRKEEIEQNYEQNTGKVIIEAISSLEVSKVFAVLVRNHGPFVWHDTPQKAVEKALVLEEVSMMAWHSYFCGQGLNEHMPFELMKKHFDRKHGANAYYGQNNKPERNLHDNL